MSRTKKILLVLLIVFAVMQLVQPARNQNGEVLSTDITRIYSMPEKVLSGLQTACFDCHSNSTRYPWYSRIQPGAWLLASHIKKGKADLNFSGFGDYSNRKRQGKLQAIINSITDGTMPIRSYTLIHRNARLSTADKVLILDWVQTIKDSLSLKN
ncbi:MAG: heme-binding domain-containing protein [Sediminibacterium sp.]